MSRTGRQPVSIPDGVKCDLLGKLLRVTGPKGTLERRLHADMEVTIVDKEVRVARPSDLPKHRALHGLTRTLIFNMIEGVTKGYQKVLQIEGVGYRASMQGKSLSLSLGYSHPVLFEPPSGISFTLEGPQTIRVSGIDKELVGQTAADIRACRKPDPYKGKGIRYQGERIRRKAGKTGKVGK